MQREGAEAFLQGEWLWESIYLIVSKSLFREQKTITLDHLISLHDVRGADVVFCTKTCEKHVSIDFENSIMKSGLM